MSKLKHLAHVPRAPRALPIPQGRWGRRTAGFLSTHTTHRALFPTVRKRHKDDVSRPSGRSTSLRGGWGRDGVLPAQSDNAWLTLERRPRRHGQGRSGGKRACFGLSVSTFSSEAPSFLFPAWGWNGSGRKRHCQVLAPEWAGPAFSEFGECRPATPSGLWLLPDYPACAVSASLEPAAPPEGRTNGSGQATGEKKK